MDQTGNFSTQCSNSNKYAVIFYIYDANAILSYPLKNLSTDELLHVFHHVYAKLCVAGFKQQLHKLDNQSSTALEMFITHNNTKLHYMPPEMHQKMLPSLLYKHGSAILRQDWPACLNNIL